MGTRYIYAYGDVGGGRLLDVNHQPFAETDLQFILGDKALLRIHCQVQTSASVWEDWQIGANDTLEACIKSSFEDENLVYCPNANAGSLDDWPQANRDQGKTVFQLRFNAPALYDKLPTTKDYLSCGGDISISPPGELPTTLRFRCRVLNEYLGARIAGDESEEDFATRAYLNTRFDAFTHPAEGLYRLEDGKLKLWDLDLEDYYPIALDNGTVVVSA